MNKSVGIISAFLGGALVGASIALLFAPEKGVDTRARIKALLKSKGIDFSDDEYMIDESCKKCYMLRICKTCYGFDFMERGSVRKRDKRACKMKLAEVQIISDFQINWLMMQKQRRKLAPIELYALKGALRCHELYNDFKF